MEEGDASTKVLLFKQLRSCRCHAYQIDLVTRVRARQKWMLSIPAPHLPLRSRVRGCNHMSVIDSWESAQWNLPLGRTGMTESENLTLGVTDDSTTRIDPCLGAVVSSKGVGSPSLAEVLNWNRMPSQDNPATCATQGPTEFLGVQPNPQQKGSVDICVYVCTYIYLYVHITVHSPNATMSTP